jgi:hypothetical protein
MTTYMLFKSYVPESGEFWDYVDVVYRAEGATYAEVASDFRTIIRGEQLKATYANRDNNAKYKICEVIEIGE